ncbi:restriction endonuclease subunit S [Nitrosomonas communis]|uniref:Type I restriction enzyme, S subunit n=1 Tax=Nitrosomonas communis TaxID=44574 RepID=A0A1H2SJD9_9PROT|nr:restriction endonuclease subunit S [Nitrosomonas communis]SDW31761.1 type I restriction enzyme, S subunit [Nitrosomonas communis]
MNNHEEQETDVAVDLRSLPEGWEWTALGDLGLVRLGKTPRKVDYRNSGDFKIVKFRDVDENGSIHWGKEDKGFIDSSPNVLSTLKELRENDVLVTASAHMSEHIGKKVGIITNIPNRFKSAYVVGEILQIRAKEGIEPKWVLFYLRSTEGFKAIQRRVYGVHLIASRAQNIEIPIAPLDQQKRIVAEIEKQFSRLDEAVANLKRVKANLKRYKAAVLKAAFEGCLVETEAELARREGRNFETGEQLLQRILETRRSQWKGKGKYKEPTAPDTTDLPELPEGWVWVRLDSIAALKGGITVDKKRQDPTARSVPYLRVANVQRGYLDLSEVKFIDAPEADIEELRMQKGDILFNEGGDRDKLGRGWIWEGQLVDCIHQNHVFRARLYMNTSSPKLVSWWGNTFGKDYFLREGKQTTNLASINLTKLSAFPVPLPPVAEQHRIVAEIDRRLSLLHEIEVQVVANLYRAERLRQSILADAFSGRLVVSNNSTIPTTSTVTSSGVA